MDLFDVKSVDCKNSKVDIKILKPDHISLGKCAACHQFIHRYSSVNHADIIELLQIGCNYNGFKKNVCVESEEEESFTHMHHVLLLSSLNELETKELCVQRINDYTVEAAQLKNENIVVSDNSSVVIFIYNSEHLKVDVYYFGHSDHSYIKIDYTENDFNVMLDCNVLFLTFRNHMTYINFNNQQTIMKKIDFDSHTCIIAMSSIMLVTCKKSNDISILQCENLYSSIDKEIIVSTETLDRLKENDNAIFSVYGDIFWLSANNEHTYVYSYSIHKGLRLINILEVKSYIPGEDNDYFFISFSHSECSKQVFLLYLQDGQNSIDKNSFVLVFDLKKLKVTSVLEMELTMNREPQLRIFTSRDGGKLLVQERFENRVIFYQIFSLLRTSFLLQGIVKRFIWNNFSKDFVLNSFLPNHLVKDVIEGF